MNDDCESCKEVAVLVENLLYAQMGGHLCPNETGKMILDKLRNWLYGA